MPAGEVIPPPYVITANDKRGLIVVTGASVLAFVWSCSLIRLWLRWQLKQWRWDDWWLSAATVLDTVQTAIILHLVTLGLGAPQDNMSLAQRERLGREGFATQILYIFVILTSKLSVLFLHLRLSPGGWHRVAVWVILVLSCIWAVLSVILVAIPCNPIQVVTRPQTCTNRWPKWLIISVLDIVTEFLIFTTAVQLVYYLNMRLSAKILVILAFSARLPVVALASVRLHYLHQRINGSYTFEYLVATQWQMGYAIMSCTITGMGPFLKPFENEHVSTTKSNGHSSSHHVMTQDTDSSSDSSILPPRRMPRTAPDNVSEFYLMDNLPTRRTRKRTMPDHRRSTSLEPAQLESQSPPAPTNMTADEHFRPTHLYRGHEAEVWVGERSLSFCQDESQPGAGPSGRSKANMVIGKKKEFKVEIDRASRFG